MSWARVFWAWRFEAGMVDGRSGPLHRMWDYDPCHEGECLSFFFFVLLPDKFEGY